MQVSGSRARVLIRSDGTNAGTRVYALDGFGVYHELAGVNRVMWSTTDGITSPVVVFDDCETRFDESPVQPKPRKPSSWKPGATEQPKSRKRKEPITPTASTTPGQIIKRLEDLAAAV